MHEVREAVTKSWAVGCQVSSASLIEGVANASTMDSVGLALDRHRLLMGERLGQAQELRHDLSSSDLLKDVHGAAVRLGHAEDIVDQFFCCKIAKCAE